MGEVYRARDTRLNRTVALKVVSPAWSNTEEGRQRFEREARVVSQINHPNVCALFDVGRADDRDWSWSSSRGKRSRRGSNAVRRRKPT